MKTKNYENDYFLRQISFSHGLAYYTAFEKKDWNSMEQILADGFTFSSPLDDHISVTAFKERCWPNAYNIK